MNAHCSDIGIAITGAFKYVRCASPFVRSGE